MSNQTNQKKRYWVDFYDMFDGWIRYSEHNPNYQFDDLEGARQKALEKQSSLELSNIKAGEHWGVIDTLTGSEVVCLRHMPVTKQGNVFLVAIEQPGG